MATATLKAKLTLNDNQYQAGLRKAVTAAKAAGAKIKAGLSAGLKIGAGAAGIAGVLAGAALTRGIKQAYDMGGALSDLQARTSVAGEALIILGRALEDNGVSASKTGDIIGKMQRTIGEAASGSKQAADALRSIGLSARELQGLSPDKQMERIGRAINSIQDPARRTAAAMDVFGRSGAELLTMFADDGAISGARESMGSMAQILAANASTFDTISDRLARVGLKFDGFLVGVASKFAPSMLAVTAAIERTDFAEQGERFGAALQKASEIFTAVWDNPEALMDPFANFLHKMWANAANFMVAAFVKGFKMVGGYMLDAVNRFRAAHIAVFEEIMSKIPGSGYDTNKTIAERQRDAERSGAGRALRNQAAKLIGSNMEIRDRFGAEAAGRRAQQGFERLRKRGEQIQKRIAGPEMIGPHRPPGWAKPEMIGPQLPPNWKANPFANFKSMGFGAGGLTSGGLNSGGLGSAYNKIRRGDSERKKAVESQELQALKKTADHTAELVTITRQAWEN